MLADEDFSLLARAAEVLGREGIESEIEELRGKTIHGCIGCAACRERKDGTCPTHQDDFGPVLEKMLAADIIITGSPVYFGSATPELMAVAAERFESYVNLDAGTTP